LPFVISVRFCPVCWNQGTSFHGENDAAVTRDDQGISLSKKLLDRGTCTEQELCIRFSSLYLAAGHERFSMKRLFICGVGACLVFSTVAGANAAWKKSSKQTLSIPPKPAQTLAIPVKKRVVRPTQKLEPIPEAPNAPIFEAPVPGPIQPIDHSVHLPPTPAANPFLPPPISGTPQTFMPSTGIPQGPINAPIYNPVVEAPGIELFTRVKYVGKRRKAPDAVSKLIVIKNPARNRKGAACCGDEFVAIEICVPPCKCELVRETKNGNRMRYNYGTHGVEVRIKNDRVVVTYHRRSRAS
jgi:hypothetical protein